MQIETIRNIAIATGAAVVVIPAVVRAVHTQAEHRAEMQLIQENANLDIEALNHAAEHVSKRIRRGEIRSLEQLTDAFNTEARFQKIAIREDN
jgi:ADP-ribosylglycohydrolase